MVVSYKMFRVITKVNGKLVPTANVSEDLVVEWLMMQMSGRQWMDSLMTWNRDAAMGNSRTAEELRHQQVVQRMTLSMKNSLSCMW